MSTQAMIAATMFAGLGLFFFAMHFLCVNLKRLADQKLKQRIARLTSSAPAGLSVGAILIVLTQSGTAAVFLLVGLLRAGMLTLKQVQPVILGLNLGAGLIVLFLTMDIRIAVLLLIGATGVLYAFGPRHKEQITGAAIGVGLLFLGLQIMRDAASQLETQAWFVHFVESIAGVPLLAFFAGIVLTLFAQSSIAVSAVMIVFLQSGLLGLQDGIMFVYGANVGGSILMMLLSINLSGVQRQVALYKFGLNTGSALILVPLFYLETMTGLPLVIFLVSSLSDNPGTQAALAYVLFNVLPVPVLLLLLNQSADLLRRISPQTRVEVGAMPKHLVPPFPEPACIAQRLVELELIRLLQLIADGFDCLRVGRKSGDLHENLEATAALHKIIEDAVNDIAARRTLLPEDHERIDMLVRILYTVGAMRDTLKDLGSEIAYLRRQRPELTFSDSAIEGLDAILSVLISIAHDRDADTLEILARLTSKRGNGINAIKVAYLQDENLLKMRDRGRLLNAMNLCERLIWLFGETGRAYGRVGRSQVEVLSCVFETQAGLKRQRA